MPTKAEYRNALDALELAVQGLELGKLVEGWGEPRHRPEIGVRLPTDVATVYQIHDAMREATRLVNINDEEGRNA